jgi:hypothetical protein
LRAKPGLHAHQVARLAEAVDRFHEDQLHVRHRSLLPVLVAVAVAITVSIAVVVVVVVIIVVVAARVVTERARLFGRARGLLGVAHRLLGRTLLALFFEHHASLRRASMSVTSSFASTVRKRRIESSSRAERSSSGTTLPSERKCRTW